MGRIGKVGIQLGEKWSKDFIISDNQIETFLIITINDNSIGDLPFIITFSDTCKNHLDFDYTLNLSSLIVPGVSLVHSTSGLFHFRHAPFSTQIKVRVDNILTKALALRIAYNLDGSLITSKSHTHLSRLQTSRLLTS
jgi:hypothetical protein